ncbi:LSU ribosomal protein L10P [Rubritalea squalenifaciens DSM 18772]|uniref:Large ribosomal subunit protein uL10 n=1 Tax=Rubritalea squalenifaciens DSM 18772 TaxID=1123071 RepID=A0A1M6EM11_9BACT|nr:50S ribosomal protein L10 [Rubritalea squalenifaciens]SHI86466.1 LSU ribosomal protein L10P [Rubritalea squalenifaciens DSM 18772]
MNPDKKIIIDELFERVNASPFVIVVDYAGTTVPQFATLRDKLREGGSECHVAKNTYMRAALNSAGLPDISSELVGQTAFITGESDVCAAARSVKEFAKDAGKDDVFKCGILDGEVLDVTKLKTLADLPSREVLLAQLLGVIKEPATQIARVLNEKIKKDGGEGVSAPAEEAAAE